MPRGFTKEGAVMSKYTRRGRKGKIQVIENPGFKRELVNVPGVGVEGAARLVETSVEHSRHHSCLQIFTFGVLNGKIHSFNLPEGAPQVIEKYTATKPAVLLCSETTDHIKEAITDIFRESPVGSLQTIVVKEGEAFWLPDVYPDKYVVAAGEVM
jgi:hypothetical protein